MWFDNIVMGLIAIAFCVGFMLLRRGLKRGHWPRDVHSWAFKDYKRPVEKRRILR